MESVDVIVIGGGAAGLMCAFEAGRRGRSVVVLEGSNRVGKKILMSGGGRCNFTNLQTEPSRFSSNNPHFCKSALSRYSQWDFIALVEKHGIPYHEKTLGQLFCDRSSKDIVTMLLAECAAAGVRVQTHTADTTIEHKDGFIVRSDQGEWRCRSLVIASGGLSIPRMGASDFGFRVARQFGLDTVPQRAGLVPFTVTGRLHEMCRRLSGVSCNATVAAGGTRFEEGILFTHRGLSGPAMLQASSYWLPGDSLSVNLLPGINARQALLHAKSVSPRAILRSVLGEWLPRALVVEWLQHLAPGLAGKAMQEIRDSDLGSLAVELHDWQVKPAATEGYRTAEVTMGGVDTAELSSRTMECRRAPGLFFVGEVVDVTGQLGGYNFQWAWASGHAAGQAV